MRTARGTWPSSIRSSWRRPSGTISPSEPTLISSSSGITWSPGGWASSSWPPIKGSTWREPSFRLGPIAWYVYGASSNRHRNLMPNYLIQWAMIKGLKGKAAASMIFAGFGGPDPESPSTAFTGSRLVLAHPWWNTWEYDLPFRPGLYRLWRKSEPWHKSILKWKESLGSFLKRVTRMQPLGPPGWKWTWMPWRGI